MAVMKGTRLAPANCIDMLEVRNAVDRLDEEIVALFAERFGYMCAAARIKSNRQNVRDEGRKAEVIANVRRLALRYGAPRAALAEIYELVVEQSIAYELECFDRFRE
jgi:isochorismate pyruvate lyase